jgi:hypothetical protein
MRVWRPWFNAWEKVAFKENLTFFCVCYITLTWEGGQKFFVVLYSTWQEMEQVLYFNNNIDFSVI